MKVFESRSEMTRVEFELHGVQWGGWIPAAGVHLEAGASFQGLGMEKTGPRGGQEDCKELWEVRTMSLPPQTHLEPLFDLWQAGESHPNYLSTASWGGWHPAAIRYFKSPHSQGSRKKPGKLPPSLAERTEPHEI